MTLRAIQVRLYPNQEQRELLDKTFGCSRFIYNKMLEERIRVYERLKDYKDRLYEHTYNTEKEYKEIYPFLREVDSIALQSSREALQNAYKHFFRRIKKGLKGKKVGFPTFKSRRNTQSYTTKSINNNCKINFTTKRLKLPKIRSWIKYRDNRIFKEKIRRITISKSRTDKYYASILIDIEASVKPIKKIDSSKIIGFDMSSSKFLITKEFELNNPRFYRNQESKIRRLNKELHRRKKGSSNRKRTRITLARIYEKIYNQRSDWIHKITHYLSEHFDCIILEDLNIKGIQKFNSGLSKSITLDFSWNRFLNILKYKMISKGKHLILIDRFYPSSQICSKCGYQNHNLTLSERKWLCPECKCEHNRDINASINIKKKGTDDLLESNPDITIIDSEKKNNDSMVGTTINAFGEDVRLHIPLGMYEAVFNELRIHSL